MVKVRHQNMAKKRIRILFHEARKAALSGRMDRANRYVGMARKMGMRYNVSLPSRFRRRICKQCYSYMLPGSTCRVRFKRGMLVTRCKECGTINRFVYNR